MNLIAWKRWPPPVSIPHSLHPRWPTDTHAGGLLFPEETKPLPAPVPSPEQVPLPGILCTTLAPSHPSSLSIFTFNSSTHLEFIQTFSHDCLLRLSQYTLSIHIQSTNMVWVSGIVLRAGDREMKKIRQVFEFKEQTAWLFLAYLMVIRYLQLSYALSFPKSEPCSWCRMTAEHQSPLNICAEVPEPFPWACSLYSISPPWPPGSGSSWLVNITHPCSDGRLGAIFSAMLGSILSHPNPNTWQVSRFSL